MQISQAEKAAALAATVANIQAQTVVWSEQKAVAALRKIVLETSMQPPLPYWLTFTRSLPRDWKLLHPTVRCSLIRTALRLRLESKGMFRAQVRGVSA
jgi:hypothetical protein